MLMLQACLDKDESFDVDELFKPLEVSDLPDRSAIIEYCFREILRNLMTNDADSKKFQKVLDISIEAAIKELCSSSLPVLLLSDMFETTTIKICEDLFSMVETRVDVWKQDSFFSGCKNHLLRCCNDLLRRLSKSQNTVFCGRIMMFLATLFPLSERSGLNIASEFNLDNKTQFSLTNPNDISDVAEERMDNLDKTVNSNSNGKSATILDYNLYRKFWELQEYFREPNQLFNKVPWKKFITYSSDVLAAFESFKLDHVKSSNWKTEEYDNPDKLVYFAKYLTSPKLLDLEMSDTNFRRYVLLQFLIMFQYLTSNVKFKSEKKLVLLDEQNNWISSTEQKIFKLIEETPPDGTNFSKCVKHILDREEHWNNWKNEGCPKFDPPAESKKVEVDAKKPAKKKRPAIGNVIREATTKKRILMGNSELTRLWNLCPDNIEACKGSKRNFMPSIDTYFDEAIEQCKPEHQIEDTYNSIMHNLLDHIIHRLIHDTNFGWKSLRLLSRQSQHFFTHSNQPSKSLPAYLESMMSKIAKEFPQNANNSEEVTIPIKQEVTEMAENIADSEDELLNNENSSEEKPEKVSVVTIDQIPLLAQKIGAQWKSLAPKLGFQDDEILFIESEHASSITEQARKMLILWTENESEDATSDVLMSAANGLKIEDVITDLFPKQEPESNDSQTDE
ncbi:THO complex subunit 1 [Nymphon striatum]|nr:THO complex subunit 1 [Nymphon striatum]